MMVSPMVITPIPPICIIASITPCPNIDQYVAVSFTTSPVTQVAETAVIKASAKWVTQCCFEEIGSISKNVPANIRAKKLKMITLKDVTLFRFFRLNN